MRWSTPKSYWLYSLQPKMKKLYTVSKTLLWLKPPNTSRIDAQFLRYSSYISCSFQIRIPVLPQHSHLHFNTKYLHMVVPAPGLTFHTTLRSGADCGSDHELLIAQFRLKLKKVEKTTRPFKYKKKVKSLSNVRLFAWTVAYQVPLSMGFPRQESWSGLPFPPPGDLPDPEIKPHVSYITGRFFFF